MTAARTTAITRKTETQQSSRGTPATMYSTADTNTVPWNILSRQLTSSNLILWWCCLNNWFSHQNVDQKVCIVVNSFLCLHLSYVFQVQCITDLFNLYTSHFLKEECKRKRLSSCWFKAIQNLFLTKNITHFLLLWGLWWLLLDMI